MIRRCYITTSHNYRYYGARGISVCQAWRDSYAAFLAHIGTRPSDKHSLDRIDNDGNYEPGNVRWATYTEQNRNNRNNTVVTVGTETKVLTAWADDLGVSQQLVSARVHSGWDAEEAVTTPKVASTDREYGRTVDRLPGSGHPNHKLTEDEVVAARAERAKGARVIDLADEYGVSKSTMSTALRGLAWKHVR